MGSGKLLAQVMEIISRCSQRELAEVREDMLTMPSIGILRGLYAVLAIIALSVGIFGFLTFTHLAYVLPSVSFLGIGGHAILFRLGCFKSRLLFVNKLISILLVLFGIWLSYSVGVVANSIDTLFYFVVEAVYLFSAVLFIGSLLVSAAQRDVASRPYRWFPSQCVAVVLFFGFNRWLVAYYGFWGFEVCYLALCVFSFSLYLTAIGSDSGFTIFMGAMVFWAIGFWFPWLITPAGLEEGVAYSRALQAVIALYFFYGLTFEEPKN